MTEMVGFNTNAALIYTIGLNPGNEPRSQVHGSYANNTNTEHMGLATNATADRVGTIPRLPRS